MRANPNMKLTTLKSNLARLPSRLAAVTGGGWRTQGMGGTERGYGYAWQQARKRHLYAHPLCVMCEQAGRVTEATVVDHKIPHRGDQALFWDESNWQSLCATHHSSDKQREENKAS
jgi:5-methylcytosine-specific restriction endonuclease McrA